MGKGLVSVHCGSLLSVYIYPFFMVPSLNFRWHRDVFSLPVWSAPWISNPGRRRGGSFFVVFPSLPHQFHVPNLCRILVLYFHFS